MFDLLNCSRKDVKCNECGFPQCSVCHVGLTGPCVKCGSDKGFSIIPIEEQMQHHIISNNQSMKTRTEILTEIKRISDLDPQPGMFSREATKRREYRIEALEWVLGKE